MLEKQVPFVKVRFTQTRYFLGAKNGFVGRLLTFIMSSQSCVQTLQNTASGSILAVSLEGLAFSQKAKESEKDTHYLYSAKCLKMALSGPKIAPFPG